MKRTLVWLLTIGAVLGASGCSGDREVERHSIKEEFKKYNMQAYNEGNQRLMNRGQGMNSGFLKDLEANSAAQGIKLTNESYSESLNGIITYNYIINGDPHHFIQVHVFPSEAERDTKMKEIYKSDGTSSGIRQMSANPNEGPLIVQNGNAALVYGGYKQNTSLYRKPLQEVFEQLLLKK